MIDRRDLLATGLTLLGTPAIARAGSASVETELREAAGTLPPEREAAKRAGIPLVPGDLVFKPVRDAENAAPLYLDFDRRRHAVPEAESNQGTLLLPDLLRGKAGPEEREAARELLKRWSSLLQVAEEAAMRPRCQFPIDWESPTVSFAPVGAMYFTARLLGARAVLASLDDRLEDALRSLTQAVRASRHATEEPTALALLMHVSTQVEIDRAFGQIAMHQARDTYALSRAAGWHHLLAPLPEVLHALRGEALINLIGARNPKEVLQPDKDMDLRSEAVKKRDRSLLRLPESLLRDAFEARLLAFYVRVFAALKRTAADPSTAYLAVAPIVEHEERQQPASYRVSSELAWLSRSTTSRTAEVAARYRLRATFLALLEERNRTGTFPERLTEAPVDPFAQKPIGYEKRGEGFVLQSIGPRLREEERQWRDGAATEKIVLAYP